MKLFMVGDFTGNTGPSIANKTIRTGLKDEKMVTYSEGKNKIARLIEIVFKTLLSDQICMCSYTKSNLFVIKIAKLFKKQTYYLMHGYSTYEIQANNKNISEELVKQTNDFEKEIFKNVDKVFCVSKYFMEFMQEAEPEYKEKFFYNYNGLDITNIEGEALSIEKLKEKQIVSIGGGMPQKNNLEVCKAIYKLNEEKNMNLTYIVIGSNTIDKDEIIKYDFVTYIDELPHNEVLNVLKESNLYVQNSDFETFGLSVIEALLSRCNLLISNNIGAKGIINTIEDRDLIFNTANIDEIACKIEKILEEKNVSRLRSGLEVDKIHYQRAARCLLSKIKNDRKNNK